MSLAALAIIAGSVAQAGPSQNPPTLPAGTVQDESMRQGGTADALREQASPPPNEGPGPFERQPGFHLFPTEPARMMPYLAQANLYNSDCLKEGAVFEHDPLSEAAQAVKTALASIGINYALWQSYTFAGQTGSVQGTREVFNYYSANLYGTWAIFDSDEMGGTAGWLTLAASGGTGLGYDANDESPRASAGTLGFPMGVDYGDQIFLFQLAWQQSFLDGQLVVTAGYLDQENYMDLNTYANNQYNQLQNYEFVTPSVFPISFQSMGAVVQWQPVDWFYFMCCTAANNTQPRQSPFEGVSLDDWTSVFEFGYVYEDLLGLGPGVFRAEPFYATVNGSGGAGLVFNVEQRLGKDLPLGFFARAGWGNPNVTQLLGTQASFAGGLVLTGPTPTTFFKGEQAYLAGGFWWLESAQPATLGQSEYGFELTYVLQLTPTLTLQPDLQVMIDPVNNPTSDAVVEMTVQLNMTW